MLNSVNAYNLSIEAEKKAIERRIVEAANYGKFSTEVSKVFFENIEDFVDELKANGYEVKFDGNFYAISWNYTAPAFNQ